MKKRYCHIQIRDDNNIAFDTNIAIDDTLDRSEPMSSSTVYFVSGNGDIGYMPQSYLWNINITKISTWHSYEALLLD